MQLFGFFEHLRCWGCTFRRSKQLKLQRQTTVSQIPRGLGECHPERLQQWKVNISLPLI